MVQDVAEPLTPQAIDAQHTAGLRLAGQARAQKGE